MSTDTELVTGIKSYVSEIIRAFELGMYQKVLSSSPDKIYLMSKKEQPFFEIFKDIHEQFYTKIFNSLVRTDDFYIMEKFIKFSVLSNGHNEICLLKIVSQIAIQVHFAIDRRKLDHQSLDVFSTSLERELTVMMNKLDVIEQMLDHQCQSYSNLQPIEKGKNFIEIKRNISTDESGINSGIEPNINVKN